MHVTREVIEEAVSQGIIDGRQGTALWALFGERQSESPSLRAAHVLYYLGGLVAIGAMTLFMTLGWEKFGGAGLVAISLAYGLVAIVLTEYLLGRGGLQIPAGITATLAIVMVPLCIYGAQHLLGFWPDAENGDSSYRDYHYLVDWRWVVMETATLVAGVMALQRYALPFMVMPLAVTLWYMSMDLSPLLFLDDDGSVSSYQRALVSLVFGLAMIMVAIRVDITLGRRRDFSFWLYLFGVVTFWGGLSGLDSDAEMGKFVYCMVNVVMIGMGAALARRVFAVFGALGVALYLGHLSHTLFEDSMLFPVALTAIGLCIMGAGIVWQRNEERIGRQLRGFLPRSLSERIDQSGA